MIVHEIWESLIFNEKKENPLIFQYDSFWSLRLMIKQFA